MKTYKIIALPRSRSESLHEISTLGIQQLQTVMDIYGRYFRQIDLAPDGTTVDVAIEDFRTLLKVTIDTLVEKKCADELNKRVATELAHKTSRSYRPLFYQ